MFTVNISGDVTLTGTQHPLFSFDGVEFETPLLEMDADLTALTSGSTLSFEHFLVNMDAGAWMCNVSFGDTSFESIPEHEFYGLNQTIDNIRLNGVPTTDMILAPGDTLSFNLTFSLHHEFVTAIDLFPLNISIVLERTNEQCTGTEETVNLAFGVPLIVDVLANDHDFEGDPIRITSVTTPKGTATITGIYPDQTITLSYGSGAGYELYDVTYWISDEMPGHVPVPVLIHVIYS